MLNETFSVIFKHCAYETSLWMSLHFKDVVTHALNISKFRKLKRNRSSSKPKSILWPEKKSQKQLKVKRLLCMWSLQSKKATVAYFLSKPLMGWMIHAAAAYLSVFKGILESYMSFLFYFQSSELKNIRYCRIIGYFSCLSRPHCVL